VETTGRKVKTRVASARGGAAHPSDIWCCGGGEGTDREAHRVRAREQGRTVLN